MFDRKKAAEFFVVAWVKNWRTQTYLEAIGAKGKPIEEITSAYPWMPSLLFHYKHGSYIRPLAARYMKKINDLLWDAKDNSAKLSLAKQIETWRSDKFVVTKDDNERHQSMRQAKLLRKVTEISNSIEVEKMRRSSGSHWNVCK